MQKKRINYGFFLNPQDRQPSYGGHQRRDALRASYQRANGIHQNEGQRLADRIFIGKVSFSDIYKARKMDINKLTIEKLKDLWCEFIVPLDG